MKCVRYITRNLFEVPSILLCFYPRFTSAAVQQASNVTKRLLPLPYILNIHD